MQRVIEIPKDRYKEILQGSYIPDGYFRRNMIEAVENGTPLPKGHGELKDMSNLQYVFDLTREDPIYSGKDIERAIKSMKSIIEADREGMP